MAEDAERGPTVVSLNSQTLILTLILTLTLTDNGHSNPQALHMTPPCFDAALQ